MAQVLTVSVNGDTNNPVTTAYTIGIGVNQIRTIAPYVGVQPLSGVTILTAISLKRDGTQAGRRVFLSPTATATVISAAG